MYHALIIDDNPNNLGVLGELLNIEGVSFTAIQHPEDLDVIFAEKLKFDVVFLDLEIPRTNGYTIFERIKTLSQFNRVPIVAYTVHVSEINVAKQMGFHSFLGKPLDADLFPEQLARILHGDPVWVTP